MTSPYYIFGKHAALTAIKNPNRKIKTVFCTKQIYEEYRGMIGTKLHEVVDLQTLDKILPGAVHQGIAAKVLPITKYGINSLEILNNNDKIAILDQITDPQNIGNILRSAVAFGVKAIISCEKNCPNENGVMAKAASGGLDCVQYIKVPNLVSAIHYLKKKGFWIMGFDDKSKSSITPEKLKGMTCILLGAEGKGIRRLVKENVDFLYKIPHINTDISSINVGSAAAITFYLASLADE